MLRFPVLQSVAVLGEPREVVFIYFGVARKEYRSDIFEVDETENIKRLQRSGKGVKEEQSRFSVHVASSAHSIGNHYFLKKDDNY